MQKDQHSWSLSSREETVNVAFVHLTY
jgi:hypothetical protein